MRKAFTLIELLIVVAIIAILAAIIFVALNPLRRFQDSRDATRWENAKSILDAIQLHQVDNGGIYLTAISSSSIDLGQWYMIVDGNGGAPMSQGCDDQYDAGNCNAPIGPDNYCIDLDELVSMGYLSKIPISPSGLVTWDSGTTNGQNGTGYALMRSSTGAIFIEACESEGTEKIIVSR